MKVMEYRFSAGVVVFQPQQGRYKTVLLDHGDFVSLPKGRIEPDESMRQTAIRELREETNLSLITISKDVVYSFSYRFNSPGGTLVDKTVFFLAGIASEMDKAEVSWEHEEILVVDLDAATDLLTYRGDKLSFERGRKWLDHMGHHY